jgi:hypothetical protein
MWVNPSSRPSVFFKASIYRSLALVDELVRAIGRWMDDISLDDGSDLANGSWRAPSA